MTSSGLDPEARAFVRKVAGADATDEEIAGDASTRRFFRVRSKGGVAAISKGADTHGPTEVASHPTAVLMVHGEALTYDAPLFSNHRILSEVGAPVPAILAREERLGLVLVEDFGDLTLQRHLLQSDGAQPEPEVFQAGRSRPDPDVFQSPTTGPVTGGDPDRWMAVARPYYSQACDLIALMQSKAPAAIRPSDFAARNALDRERFLFELGHFDKHFLRGLRGVTPSPTDEGTLSAFYEELADACDALPRVYCHRDYQSRNLMVRPAHRIGLVDFQDARMGPYTYDAASLLRDSSLDLDPALVSEMLRRLARSIAHPLAVGPEEFRRDFDLMALQRNIKDLGTFGFMATVRGRRDYLEYVPRTQASIRRTMTADPRWHDAFEAFSRLAL